MSVPDTEAVRTVESAERSWRVSRHSAEGRRDRLEDEGFRVDMDQKPLFREARRIDRDLGPHSRPRLPDLSPPAVRPRGGTVMYVAVGCVRSYWMRRTSLES